MAGKPINFNVADEGAGFVELEWEAGLSITTTSLPNGVAGQNYIAELEVTGGTGPITHTVQSGSLPTGLSLNSSTGQISGTYNGTSGTSPNFTIRSTDSLGEYDEQVFSITFIDPPTSKWKRGGFVPTQDLTAWWDALVAPSGNSGPDLSGNGKDLAEDTNPPTLVPNARNSNPWWYFDGVNDRLTVSAEGDAVVAKHLFIVCALDRETFAGEECLITSSQPNSILSGSSGTTKFDNSLGYISSFRKNGVLYELSNMQAPVNNELAIIEVVLEDESSSLDDTALIGVNTETNDYWKGPIAEILAYSVELADYLRGFIYDYLAMKWLLWQQDSAGRYVFPFVADRVRSIDVDQEHYLSEPYEGNLKALVRGEFTEQYELPFSLRWREEALAAKAFFQQHRPITPFTLRDCHFDPPRELVVRTNSSFRLQGSNVSHKVNYSFGAVQVEEDADESSSSSSSSSSS